MKQAISAGVFSKNACTWSSGRPPFVAAFGRIPRVGYDLFSDERALVTGETRDQAQQFANILRVEAQQPLASMSVDSKVRRALLRKTPHETEKEAPAGSIVAYWRWTSPSGKKRGGYRLARMLGMDPDKKSYWLQSGTNTVKVAKHQLRLAHGFEQWKPDGEDIKTLRIAGDNFRDGILDDQRLPEPPLEEEDPDNPVGWDRYTCWRPNLQQISLWFHRFLKSFPPVQTKSKKACQRMFNNNLQQLNNILLNNNRTSPFLRPFTDTQNNISLLDYHLNNNIYDQSELQAGSPELDLEHQFETFYHLNYQHHRMQFHYHQHQLYLTSSIRLKV